MASEIAKIGDQTHRDIICAIDGCGNKLLRPTENCLLADGRKICNTCYGYAIGNKLLWQNGKCTICGEENLLKGKRANFTLCPNYKHHPRLYHGKPVKEKKLKRKRPDCPKCNAGPMKRDIKNKKNKKSCERRVVYYCRKCGYSEATVKNRCCRCGKIKEDYRRIINKQLATFICQDCQKCAGCGKKVAGHWAHTSTGSPVCASCWSFAKNHANLYTNGICAKHKETPLIELSGAGWLLCKLCIDEKNDEQANLNGQK